MFGVIEWFSDDIDLSLSPEFLKLPEAGTSRNQANKWMTRGKVKKSSSVRGASAPGGRRRAAPFAEARGPAAPDTDLA